MYRLPSPNNNSFDSGINVSSTSRSFLNTMNDLNTSFTERNNFDDYTSINEHKLLVISQSTLSQENENVNINGRRIINFEYFINEIKKMNDHSPFSCNFNHTQIINERRNGFKSIFTIKCMMCDKKFILSTEDSINDITPINTAVVSGIIAIGAGYSQLQQLTSAIEIPCMGSRLYNKEQNKVFDNYEEIAAKEMEKSAKEEARLAIEAGNVDVDGTPLVTVIADGSWCKRSYKTVYNSLSGAVKFFDYYN